MSLLTSRCLSSLESSPSTTVSRRSASSCAMSERGGGGGEGEGEAIREGKGGGGHAKQGIPADNAALVTAACRGTASTANVSQ